MHDAGSDLMNTLSTLPLFAGLPPAPLRDLARSSYTALYQRDDTIFRAGEVAQVLYVVLSGHIKRAMPTFDGNEKVLDVVSPGQIFGEAELLGERAYASYAVAAAPALLLCIGGDGLRRAIGQDAQLALRILAALAHRQYDMECDSVARRVRTGCQRVLDYLLQLAGKRFSPTGETVLSLPVSKQLVAARIGITTETLSRALRELSDSGLILVDGRYICLQNTPIARHLADAQAELPAVAGEPDKGRRSAPLAAVTRRPVPALAPESGAAPGRRTLSLCSAINIAGRQRMLSQRMANYWVMLGQGVRPKQARNHLDTSILQFEGQMAELAALHVSTKARAAREELQAAWLPYRALLACTPDRSGAALIFEQSEKMLAAAHELTQALADAADTPTGRVIGFAGRQRMLSQRMAKFFLFRQWGVNPDRCCAELQHACEEFGTTLGELFETPLGSPLIRTELTRVSRQWRLFQAVLATSEEHDDKAAATMVVSASERILERCDTTVSLYEKLDGSLQLTA